MADQPVADLRQRLRADGSVDERAEILRNRVGESASYHLPTETIESPEQQTIIADDAPDDSEVDDEELQQAILQMHQATLDVEVDYDLKKELIGGVSTTSTARQSA